MDHFLAMVKFQQLFPELSERVQKYRRIDNHTALIILFSGAHYVFRWESTKSGLCKPSSPTTTNKEQTCPLKVHWSKPQLRAVSF